MYVFFFFFVVISYVLIDCCGALQMVSGVQGKHPYVETSEGRPR